MSDEATIAPRRLRPWFWLVLFLTPVFSLVANGLGMAVANIKSEAELPWLIILDVFIAPSLMLICSAFCAVHLSRVRTGRAHLGWILGGLAGFVVLNLALAFGGCMLGMTLGEGLAK